MDFHPNTALLDLPVSQLLAALDRKIPNEIAWLESNARSRGILAHFRNPEVRDYAPLVVLHRQTVTPHR